MGEDKKVLPVYQWAMEALATADLAGAADRLGLAYDKGIRLEFLCQPYKVTKKGVFMENGEPATQAVSALLIQYCLSDTTSRPTGHFVSIGQLAGPGSGIGSYFSSEILAPLDREFSEDLKKLENRALELGAKRADISITGGVGFTFEPLNHIPVCLVFYPADDEFSAGGSILLDASATDFLGFETLAFLVTTLFRALIHGNFQVEKQV